MGQSTVFSQVIKLIPRSEFESIVSVHGGNKWVRTLDCWTWFGALLFGQFTGHDSIRAIARIFSHSDKGMQKLGFGSVRRSTLADANRTRSVLILEDVFQYVLNRALSVAPDKNRLGLSHQVLALDSTTIDLCLSLCPWARFRKGRSGAKLHTAIDIANDLPEFAVITPAKFNDMRIVNELHFLPGTIVVFDRGYNDFGWYNELNQSEVFFVTRARKNMRYKIDQCFEVNRTQGLKADQDIYLKDQRKRYKGKLRRISYKDPDTGKWLIFLTNNFDIEAKTICDIYKNRWKVELFFKTLKQNLRIKKFLGTTENAVKSQILVALIAYLLVQIWRYSLKSSVPIPEAMAVIGTLLLLKEPLSRLLGTLPCVTRYPPVPQLCLRL